MKKISLWVHSRNWYLLLVSLFFFLFFVGFSFIVHKNLLNHFDFNMTVRLQDHITRRLDVWFSFFSSIGNFEPMTIILLILLGIRRKLMGFFTLCVYGGMHLFEIFGKTFVNHLPPPEFMLRTQHILNFPQFYVRLQNSYPSGHMGRALFITTFLATVSLYSKKFSRTQKVFIIICLVIYDMVMSVSRIYLGEHWTTDVIGGSLLGISFGLIGVLLAL